ncbi:MAG: 50S ribosomal protein L21 [Coriobacteriales bacterium]|nr:50S ribosomal protein L21 [Coriobacteriales bacterium]
MYAVVRTGSKQYKVELGEKLNVEKLNAKDGDSVTLETLLINDDKNVITDASELEKLAVKATVVEQTKGEKLIVFKFKKRKRYKKKNGHRQQLTTILIDEIAGKKAEIKKPAKKEEDKEETKKPEVKETKDVKTTDKKEDKAADNKEEAKSEDISKLTVAQLKDLAKEKGISIPSGARKAEIIELINKG